MPIRVKYNFAHMGTTVDSNKTQSGSQIFGYLFAFKFFIVSGLSVLTSDLTYPYRK